MRQIRIDEETYWKLKKEAALYRASMAETVHRLLEELSIHRMEDTGSIKGLQQDISQTASD